MNDPPRPGHEPPQAGGWFATRLHRPPLVGLAALFAVFLALPLTHALSMVARETARTTAPALVYLPIGIVALGLLVHGIRRNTEVAGTLIGFASGLLLWTGWAAYAFRFNEWSLGLPMQALTAGARWPANLLFIQGSVGICLVTLLFFALNRDTRCNAFLWLQRRLRLGLGAQAPGQGRNFCRITFAETVYVTWFCYGASLFLADPRFIGYHSPAGYAVTGGLAAWGLYLVWRLLKFTRVMAGIRYAIPTKAILWIPFGEVFPKYGWYEEVWLRPWDYPGTMLALLLALAALFLAAAVMPQRRTH
ncbi:MAG: hypothetical protein IT486_03245 [Gammaproteobacteria bacterium]|nr:hypothetical protein [Gammaproteobacteria bacterium]